MNVVISNSQQERIANLDIDVIKSINGVHEVAELVETFKNFFYSKMILDVTAIKNYESIKTYELLVQDLDPEKMILLLPEGSNLCTPDFLVQLIDLGIYNFTTNLNGIKYLLNKPNTLKDVEHIKDMANKNKEVSSDVTKSENPINDNIVSVSKNSGDNNNDLSLSKVVTNSVTIVGFKNATEHAGSTTLIYMLKKELVKSYGNDNVVAVEVDSNNFSIFNDPNMVSVSSSEAKNVYSRFSNANIILVDLNKSTDNSYCNDVIYLIEPSTLKLNLLARKSKDIFTKLATKKVVLNQSLLSSNDVSDLEHEVGIKVFYNMPPLDERKHNDVVNDFLIKLGLLKENSNSSISASKIFGLFRR